MIPDKQGVIGWDIGAANVKGAWVETDLPARAVSRPYEIWREQERLPGLLCAVHDALTRGAPVRALAVTTTAELSDLFATKREGVQFIFDCVGRCFPETPAYALNLEGEFEPLAQALGHPLDFAAANWLASARWLAQQLPDCLLVDVGSTTTDILPIRNGEVAVRGRTDTARLAEGELVYTGVLRTNLAAVVQAVPLAGRTCRVASEFFSITADVHLILGHLAAREYACPTPDGRPPTLESARGRLARLVCADTETLSPGTIDELARHICDRQTGQIMNGMKQVMARDPEIGRSSVVAAGAGAFLARAAAERLGLPTLDADFFWSGPERSAAPAVAVARLLAEYLERNR